MKEMLYGKTPAELREVAAGLGMPRHAAGQMAAWLYRRGAVDIAAMTDISAAHRTALAERFEIGLTPPVRETVSADGTRKYLFEAAGGAAIEAAMIPDDGRERETKRATLCLSSQAGCRMGCVFCATGRQGLLRSLTAGGILNQFASLPERDALTNIVYMGMGEPLDNPDEVLKSLDILTSEWGYGWSPTRITLSTAGVAPAMERFLRESRVHLAVSLHNPFHDERAAIMPVERAWPIEGIVGTLRRYPLEPQRRISFEYIVMSGLNDSPRHVAGLVKLLGGLSCRLNLIRFHTIPGSPFFSPPADAMERLRDNLTRRGIRTTVRASRGEDIEAACGLLSTRNR
ncbi:MAG: 23S rRNA (adenine(2503)-C(2))-methyltransferase RlmN [Alistipes sp.]|jgi:23S rRNA (adenine2503-C2)-methyltransferase|nr:23S rRNA (adenine(2503)-C(2))-methyltransferase RlmN [Alistipes sp.]